jgi:putative intracellular protease/amidase
MFPDDVGKFLENPEVQKKLLTVKKLSEVNPDDYDGIFYVGGHGPVLDLAADPVNIQLASKVRLLIFLVWWAGNDYLILQFYRAGKLVAAVCHGPALAIA